MKYKVLAVAVLIFLAIVATIRSGKAQTTPPSDCVPPVLLPPGTYTFQEINGNTLDSGWYFYGGFLSLHEYYFNNGPNQQFIYDATRKLCSVGTGLCLT